MSGKQKNFLADETQDAEPIEELRLADELARIHEEVLAESARNGSDETRGHIASQAANESAERVGSAKRVMELLAAVRPDQALDIATPRGDGETRADELHANTKNDHSDLRDDKDVPRQIGRFEIRELIGQGGFGMVFRAFDPALARDVALKIPTASALLNAESRERFERECRVVASLSHPGIVPVFEVGHDGPVAFLAAEFVEGTDLAKWVQANGVASLDAAARSMVTIAEAVQHAHLRGVVHRDLKPANILVADGKLDHARLDPESLRITDFGLAKFCDEETSLTQAGSVLGTPAFAAPEQLNGNAESISSELGDVYSLGAVLYFQLTGQPPFAADSVLALVQKVQTEDPMHPSKVRDSIPSDLSAICLRAMDKNPSQRYSSAWEFKADLERFLNNEPTIARPLSVFGKVRKWHRRNPVVAALGMLLLIALASGFSTTYYQWRGAQANLAEAVKQRDRSELLLEKAEESIDAMLNSTADALKNIPAMTEVRRQMLKDALAIQVSILEEEKANGVAIKESVESLRRMARIQQELGEFQDAKSTIETAIELIGDGDDASAEQLIEVASIYQLLTDMEMQLGDLEAANLAGVKLAELSDRINPGDASDASQRIGVLIAKAKSVKLLGQLAEKNGNLDAAIAHFENAVSAGNEARELAQIDKDSHSLDCNKVLISSWNSLGIILRANGELERAHEAYLMSLSINAESIETRPADRELLQRFATTNHNLANLLFQRKQFAEAGSRYQKAIDSFSDLSDRFPSVYLYQQRLPSAYAGLALIQKKQGDLAAARETVKLSIQLSKASRDQFGATQGILGGLANAMRSLASIEANLGDYESADKSFQRAEMATRELVELSPTNPTYLYELSLTEGNEGDSLIGRRQFDHAIECLERAVEDGQKAVGLSPKHARYQRSLRFVQGKLVEAMIGDQRFDEVAVLIDRFASADRSPAQLQSMAESVSDGLLHLVANDDVAKSKIATLIDRIFSLLDSAVEEGLSLDKIDFERLRSVSGDKRLDKFKKSAQ